jgi:hypothetical protein
MAGSPRRKSRPDAVPEQDGLPPHAYATGVPHRSARQHGVKPASNARSAAPLKGLVVVKKQPKTAPSQSEHWRVVSKHACVMATRWSA